MNDELSKNATTLLDAARRQGGPTIAQKAKLTAAVMTATASTAAAMTTGGAATGVSLATLVGAGVIATIVGASGTLLVKTAVEARRPGVTLEAERVPAPVPPPPPVTAAPVQQAAPAVVVEAAPPPPVEPAAAPAVVEAAPRGLAPVRAARPPLAAPPAPVPTPEVNATQPPETPAVPSRTAPARTTPSETTAAEVTALGLALEALDEGRPTDALQAARGARRSAPNGALRPELTVVEVEALCALQREAEASELAASMPDSDRTPLVLQRLRRTCIAR